MMIHMDSGTGNVGAGTGAGLDGTTVFTGYAVAFLMWVLVAMVVYALVIYPVLEWWTRREVRRLARLGEQRRAARIAAGLSPYDS